MQYKQGRIRPKSQLDTTLIVALFVPCTDSVFGVVARARDTKIDV